MSESSLVIDYAVPKDDRPSVNVDAARGMFWFSWISPTGGMAILAFAYCGGGAAALFGILWLIVGGLMTIGLTVAAIVGFFGTFSRGGDVGRARKWFGGTIGMGGASSVIAVLCLAVGSEWVGNPPFRLTVQNQTAKTVDVVFHFSDGDVTIRSVGPGQTAASSSARHQLGGALDMSVIVNGQSRRSRASDYLDEDNVLGLQPLVITPDTLPKGTP